MAISIPIFTSQLEKAREATDKANIRSVNAQLSADVLTENTTSTTKQDKNVCPAAATYSVTKDDTTGNITGTATYTMTQKTAGLVGGGSVIIGGVTINSDDFKLGKATITIKDDGSAPSIKIGE